MLAPARVHLLLFITIRIQQIKAFFDGPSLPARCKYFPVKDVEARHIGFKKTACANSIYFRNLCLRDVLIRNKQGWFIYCHVNTRKDTVNYFIKITKMWCIVKCRTSVIGKAPKSEQMLVQISAHSDFRRSGLNEHGPELNTFDLA